MLAQDVLSAYKLRPVLATHLARRMIIEESGGYKVLNISAEAGSNAHVLSAFRSRFGSLVASMKVRAKSIAREAAGILPVLSGLATDIVRSRDELIAENVLLRQQLVVASRKVKRPAFLPHERGLLAALTKLVPRLLDTVLLVKPDTILRWHREGFRLFGKRKSKSSQREPRLSAEVIELIQQMAGETAFGKQNASAVNCSNSGSKSQSAPFSGTCALHARRLHRADELAFISAKPHRLGLRFLAGLRHLVSAALRVLHRRYQ
jgi:hypothetical protein